jgi:hypothetical protein
MLPQQSGQNFDMIARHCFADSSRAATKPSSEPRKSIVRHAGKLSTTRLAP